MPLRKDIWRSGIVAAPAADIVRRGSLADLPVTWLPGRGAFRFLADPFGLWRDGQLYVFVETYDYRDRIGRIEVLIYDAALQLTARHLALAEPWHLSYPYVFEAHGETWLLPEAHRSGRLTLYRAAAFPQRWEAAATIDLPHGAVDATPLFHDGLWWLFHAPATSEPGKQGALHIAYAERLQGPWRPHPANPVRRDAAGSRPGGTPIVVDGHIVLPVQDCSRTYGGGIRPLFVERLTPDRFEATIGPPVAIPRDFAPFTEGLHTLAAAGPVTLIDVKRTVLSPRGLGIEVRRHLRRRAR